MQARAARFGFSFPGAMIFLLFAITTASSGFYSVFGFEKSVDLELIERVLWIWIVGWWLTNSIQTKSLPYCVGIFVVTLGPLLVLYYLFKTRGVRALIVIGVLLVVIVAGYISGVVLGVVLQEIR
jgi:hypothetical protein